MWPQSTPYPIQLAVLAAVYFVLAKASLFFAIPPGYASAIWPAAGLALAALWMGGLRLWPGVFIGAAAGYYAVEGSLATALAIGLGDALEALAGGWLARRFLADRRGPFSQPRYVMRFFGVALAASPIAATLGVAQLASTGNVAPGTVLANWLTWWLGDATGMMIFTALIVAWSRPGRVTWTPAKIAEGLALLVALVLCATEVFTGRTFGPHSESLGFVVLPFIIWAAIRFGGREAVTMCVVVGIVALAATANGTGPFAPYGLYASLLLQQAFVATLVAIGLVLAGLMRQLNRLAETKRRAHAEMEHMIHLAAHDLQEPIRTVINFSDLLSRRYADQLGAEGLEYLRFITGGATQSRLLIGELLELLEAGRRRLVLEKTGAEDVLDAALQSLKGAVEESGATVSVSALPQVRADRRLLQSVFQNLLGNAIRYRSQAAPRVKVSAELQGKAWVFSVRDNGIGIDPRFQAEIFDAFRRLGPRGADDGGAGLGLALCKKVIERHGGRIWLESPPSGGSIFHFSLPAEAPEHGTG